MPHGAGFAGADTGNHKAFSELEKTLKIISHIYLDRKGEDQVWWTGLFY